MYQRGGSEVGDHSGERGIEHVDEGAKTQESKTLLRGKPRNNHKLNKITFGRQKNTSRFSTVVVRTGDQHSGGTHEPLSITFHSGHCSDLHNLGVYSCVIRKSEKTDVP